MRQPSFFRLAVFAGCLALAILPGALRAQQITNGSFELSLASTTVQGPGTGWTNDGSNNVYVYSNAFGHGTTDDGTQWLFIYGGGISQIVTGPFTIGMRYALIFRAADVQAGSIPSVAASVTGGATANQLFSLPRGTSYYTNAPLAFTTCELDFVPTTAAPITISIRGFAYPSAVDSILLVPEPSTWAMLGMGAVGTGFMALRWRRARA